VSNKYVRSFVTTATTVLICAAVVRVAALVVGWLIYKEWAEQAVIVVAVAVVFAVVWGWVHFEQNS